MQEPKNIFSFCFAGFPGTNRQLRELSQTVGLSRHFSLTDGVQRTREIIFYRDLLVDAQPSLVIFGSWTPAYDWLLEELSLLDSQSAVLWTSSPGQVDISAEMGKLANIIQDTRIDFRLFASSSFGIPFSRYLRGCYILPHTLNISEGIQRPNISGHIKNGPTIISLFCSPNEYRRKNILNALLALTRIKGDFLLYVNGLTSTPAYKTLLDTLKIPYKDFGWMDAKDYQNIFDQIDVGLQLSFSESFNYVVADHLLKGIPIITSEAIPIMHGIPSILKELLVVRNEDDPQEIQEKLQFLIDYPSARFTAGEVALKYLKQANTRRLGQARSTLETLLQSCRRQQSHEQSASSDTAIQRP